MRNALTVFALLLSSTGIFVSLAREELRCRIGLSSTECSPAIAQPENSPPSNHGIKSVGSSAEASRSYGAKLTNAASPGPETAKVIENSGQTLDNITPSEESVTTEGKKDTDQSPASSVNSPLGAPMEQKPALDTAAIGSPIPQKGLPSADPIAPPAAKNPAENNLIPVIPAEGVAIPVAPANQE
jgi:hypothetical protein